MYGKVGERTSQALSIVHQKRLSNQYLSLHSHYLCLLVSYHSVNRYLFHSMFSATFSAFYAFVGDSTV